MKNFPIPALRPSQNSTTVVLNFPTKWRWLRVLWELLALPFELKKKKITLFHGPSFFVPMWKPKRCKYIITVNDLAFIKYPNAFWYSIDSHKDLEECIKNMNSRHYKSFIFKK